jgi:cytochrome b561
MQRYQPSQRWLHWITAGLIVLMFTFGIWMTAFEPADETLKFRLYDLHESTGITIWLIVLLRLILRAVHGAPPLPAETPEAVRFLARMNHAALYLVLLVQPVLGFLDTNLWGFPVTWWWSIPIPSPVGKDTAIAPLFKGAHLVGAALLFLLLMLHVAGAAYHGLVRRDGVVRRMA